MTQQNLGIRRSALRDAHPDDEARSGRHCYGLADDRNLGSGRADVAARVRFGRPHRSRRAHGRVHLRPSCAASPDDGVPSPDARAWVFCWYPFLSLVLALRCYRLAAASVREPLAIPDGRWLLELYGGQRFRLSDQHANRQLFREIYRQYAQAADPRRIPQPASTQPGPRLDGMACCAQKVG
jgi:hypothetical protein